MSSKAAGPVGRPMEYPYTFVAKAVQFPLKFYMKNHWVWKTLPYAILICVPLYYKIQKATYSPENVAKWKEIRKKDREPHIHD